MKSLIFIFVTVMTSASFAGFPGFNPDGKGKPDISGLPTPANYIAGEVIAIEQMCPGPAICFVDGTNITMKFTLPTACSELLPLTFEVLEDGVEVAAIEETAINQLCAPVLVEEVRTISLIDLYPPFTLSFKGTDVTADIEKYELK